MFTRTPYLVKVLESVFGPDEDREPIDGSSASVQRGKRNRSHG